MTAEINSKRLMPREKILLIGCLGAFGAVIYFQAVTKPLAGKIEKFKSQIKKSEALLNDLTASSPQSEGQENNIKILDAECKRMREEIKEIEKEIPSKNSISRLLTELVSRAKGVRLASLRQEITSVDEYSKVFIKLNFYASYEEAAHYLQNIEAISPFLTVEELDISESKDTKNGEGVSGEGISVGLVVSSLLGQIASHDFGAAPAMKEPVPIARDIFFSKARPVAVTKAGKIEFKLDGITFRAQSPTAIINGDVVKIGSQIQGLTVKEIRPDSVVLIEGKEERVLSLQR